MFIFQIIRVQRENEKCWLFPAEILSNFSGALLTFSYHNFFKEFFLIFSHCAPVLPLPLSSYWIELFPCKGMSSYGYVNSKLYKYVPDDNFIQNNAWRINRQLVIGWLVLLLELSWREHQKVLKRLPTYAPICWRKKRYMT